MNSHSSIIRTRGITSCMGMNFEIYSWEKKEAKSCPTFHGFVRGVSICRFFGASSPENEQENMTNEEKDECLVSVRSVTRTVTSDPSNRHKQAAARSVADLLHRLVDLDLDLNSTSWLPSTSTPAYNSSCGNSSYMRPCCAKYARKQKKSLCENLTWCMSARR